MIESTCSTCQCNKVCDHNKYGFENCGNYITADVVPREEFEALQRRYDLAVAEREANVKGFTEEISRMRAYVAREIFEEIDILGTYNPTLYAELKKKYTGDVE